MAKPKPNLAGLLDNIPDAPQPSAPRTAARSQRRDVSPADGPTVLVGANLPPAYARNLAILHAETGHSKKQLLREALDMLFTAKAGAGIKF
jgi:hypothetical protein